MQVRKLDIMDGPESELKIFSKFLHDSLEHRKQGLASRVNGQAMSTAIQTGALVALIAEEDGKAIGMQLWELVNNGIWFDTAFKVKNMRFQFMLENSANKQVEFLHHGINAMRQDTWQLLSSVHKDDQTFEVAKNCGLLSYGASYELN